MHSITLKGYHAHTSICNLYYKSLHTTQFAVSILLRPFFLESVYCIFQVNLVNRHTKKKKQENKQLADCRAPIFTYLLLPESYSFLGAINNYLLISSRSTCFGLVVT